MSPRTPLLAAALAAAAVVPAGAASAAPQTRDCASVKAGHGTASGIRATGLGCAKARTVVRACLRDSLHGWRVSHAPSLDDTNPKGLVGLDRGSAHVSFSVKGRGACG